MTDREMKLRAEALRRAREQATTPEDHAALDYADQLLMNEAIRERQRRGQGGESLDA